MKVYLRKSDEAFGSLFTEIDHERLDELLAWINARGGVTVDGDTWSAGESQICLDERGARVEIVVGE
jgi:hypothetical protein